MANVRDTFDFKRYRTKFIPTRLNAFAASATQEAISDANLTDLLTKLSREQKTKYGVSFGVLGSNTTFITEIMDQVQSKGLTGINRMTMLNMLNNMTAGSIGINYGLGGPLLSASTSCSTGLSVVADGFMMIRNNKAEMMVCGSAEDIKNEFVFQACLKMQALFNKPIEDPTQASCPFDINRSGFILGEGAGALILESLDHALERNAKIYAEIKGVGYSSDGTGLAKPDQTGASLYNCMKMAIDEWAESDPEGSKDCTGLVNAHATSTVVGDQAEALAISRISDELFGKDRLFVTANKGAIGHGFGAAGSIESVFGIKSLQTGVVPKI